MKLEIEVELPKSMAKYWEVVKIAVPVDGEYVITSFGGVAEFNRNIHEAVPRVILRRKLNPEDWWPKWVLADMITLEKNGAMGFHANNVNSEYWNDDAAYSVFDFSWIPKHLRRSGTTIQNPWKGEQ